MFRRTKDAADDAAVSVSSLETRCVIAVRASIVSSYPLIDVDEVLAIGRSFGLRRLPDALFVDGELDDGTARAVLSSALSSDPAERGDPHPLFSNVFYDLNYPSVTSSGIAPWVHYHMFGIDEGLSPHVLLDVDYLGSSDPGSERRGRIDRYLTERSLWFRASSPHVDVERFLISGQWRRDRHPLVEVVTSRPEWIQDRLMVVDSNWGEIEAASINAAGYLLTRGPASGMIAAIDTYDRDEFTSPGTAADWTVIPGVFLGSATGGSLSLSDDVLSPDGTMVRLRDRVLIARGSARTRAGRLIVARSGLSRRALDALLDETRVTDAISPFSPAQEAVLTARVSVLPAAPAILAWGHQTIVPNTVAVLHEEAPLEPVEWRWDSDDDPAGTVFVLPGVEAAHRRVLESWLARGSDLCIVAAGFGPWIPTIERASRIVTIDRLVQDVRHITEDECISVVSRSAR